MSDVPKVSIVIAAYRSRPQHLDMAVASALAQTWQEIEVIVSDDSPDEALGARVAAYRDPRLCYRHNRPALGVACNHWQAFATATGDFLVVLNHDDWLAPTFVERLLAPLRRDPHLTLAFCDHWVIDVAGERQPAQTEANTRQWGRDRLAEGLHRPFGPLVAMQTIPIAMGTLFRRAALPAALPGDAGPAYDLWLGYLLARGGGGAWFVRERLSAWRSHDGNLSTAGGLDWLQGAATCWQAIAQDPGFAAQHRLARRRAAQSWRGCARQAWRLGQRGRGLQLAWRAVLAGLR